MLDTYEREQQDEHQEEQQEESQRGPECVQQ